MNNANYSHLGIVSFSSGRKFYSLIPNCVWAKKKKSPGACFASYFIHRYVVYKEAVQQSVPP